jgi:hypothetical protein
VAVTIGPRLEGFFAEVLPAIITTINERGAPEMTPLWYEYADGKILLNGDKTRIWMDRMGETGRATLFVLDPKNFWRWVQVYGNVIDISDDPGGEHINKLSHRYRGADYPSDRRGTRRTVQIEITSIKGADGSPQDKWDVS